MPKKPELCNSNDDCIESETCYMGFCVNPCQFHDICPKNATCIPKMHRATCVCNNGDISTNCTTYTLCKGLFFYRLMTNLIFNRVPFNLIFIH